MSSLRVLLVDDDSLICIALGRGLERRGYAVTTAASGMQAWAAFEHEAFDVVVSDILMQAPDGLVLLRRCKELRPDTPVLLLTGYADVASAVEAVRLGADDYLSKPCNAEQLSARIEECVEKQRSSTRSGAAPASAELHLREVHHRLKNDLLTLSALVGLQLPYVRDDVDRTLFRGLRTRVQTLALVYEELFRGRAGEKVDASRFFSELCRQTIRGFNPSHAIVSLRVDASDGALSPESATTIGLIVDELLMNSMKHAFEPGGKGRIELSFRREAKSYRLEIGDDGKGLPDGFTVEGAATLGMQVIAALISQLGGAIHYRLGRGARFVITFPADALVQGSIPRRAADTPPG